MRPPTPLALLPPALLGGVLASAPVQQSVPDVGTEVVRLDAVVTDAAGRLVRDLTRADFRVLEDGEPQRLTEFLVVGRAEQAASAPDAATTARADVATGEAAGAVEGPGRQVVIVVDDLHIALRNLVETKRALRRLVDEFLAGDRIALIPVSGPGGVQRFTTSPAELRQAIERLTVRVAVTAGARGSQLSAEQAALILRGDPSALRLAAMALLTEPGSVFEGNTPRVAVEAPPGAGPAPGTAGLSMDAGQRAAEAEARRQASGILEESLRFSSATLVTLEDVVRGLAPLPGRKLCILVSDGFLDGEGTRHSRAWDLRRIVDAATRSGTVVYSLDTRGLASGSDAALAGRGVPAGLQHQVDRASEQLVGDTLARVAEGTGGFMVSATNDLAGGLSRILRDSESYYLMAYSPTNTARDGRFRRIEVELPHHPGLRVRTRAGYFATTARASSAPGPDRFRSDPASSATLGLAEAEAHAALSAPLPAAGIPVHLAADYLDLPPEGSQVIVRAHVDLTGVDWQPVEGRHRAVLELVGGVYGDDGSPIGPPFGRRAELDVAAAELEQARAAGLDYQHRLPLGPGLYEVRLLARQPGLREAGGATQRIQVPDLAGGKLSISGVFLSASSDASAAGEGLRDVQARRRFERRESLYFQFYVYNARLDADGASQVVFQAQVWSGTQMIAASKALPALIRRQEGLPLPETYGMPLEGLSPGAYELRVLVEDRLGQATTLRRVGFSVE
jgi:VWFA-related protein